MNYKTEGMPMVWRITIAVIAAIVVTLVLWLAASWVFGGALMIGVLAGVIAYLLTGMAGGEPVARYHGDGQTVPGTRGLAPDAVAGAGAATQGATSTSTSTTATDSSSAEETEALKAADHSVQAAEADMVAADADAAVGATGLEEAATDAVDSAPQDAGEAADASADAEESKEQGAAQAAETAGSGSAAIKPSARLPGEEELAAQKGTWRYDASSGAAGDDADAGSESAVQASADAEAVEDGGQAEPSPAMPAAAGTAQAETDATSDTASGHGAAQAASVTETSAEDARETAAETVAAASAETSKEPPKAGGADKGGNAPAAENAGEVAPSTLYSEKPSDADDLKQIKGVGPGLEKTLNELGIYKFAQIMTWGGPEIAWVDARLKFKGRITRDNWVDQAKTLAEGGATEFSKKVDKGGVY